MVVNTTMNDLVTERLTLHPMSAAEAEQVVAGEPGPGALWAPGYPAEVDVQGARSFLALCASNGDPQPFGSYEIRRREDGHTIGGLGFNAPPDGRGGVTIGYGVIPSARGQGYASEALLGLLRFARSRGITCVRGDADHDNTASQRVMIGAGMRLVAEDERVKYYEITWTGPTQPTGPRPLPLRAEVPPPRS